MLFMRFMCRVQGHTGTCRLSISRVSVHGAHRALLQVPRRAEYPVLISIELHTSRCRPRLQPRAR